MIVNIAAWLYILAAALNLSSIARIGAHASVGTLATLLSGVLMAALGVGLLKRLPWARWLALGSSLLGWTLGPLVLIGCIGLYFAMGTMMGGLSRGGLGSMLGLKMFLVLSLMAASIVINFLLYFYLRSEAGAREFGVSLESFGMVMGSVGAWVVICVAQTAMTFYGPAFRHSPRSADHANYERIAAERRETNRRLVREQQQRAAEERRAALEEQQRARFEAERASMEEESAPPADANQPEEPPAIRYQPITAETEDSETEVSSRNQILKCRDGSGAVQYTQGYCPPGTTRVDSPRD
jgi:hypothetical protein